MESELEKIGKEAGLGKDDTSRLLKELIDKHYIDPGRALQAGNRVEGQESSAKGEVVGYGGVLFHIGYDMKLTDKARAEISA
jgi:hypothetical protein